MKPAGLALAFFLASGFVPAHAGYETPPDAPLIAPPGSGEWSALARFFIGYDSNILQVGDADPFFIGRTDSFLAGVSLNATWQREFDDGLRAGVAARMDASWVPGKQSPYIPGLNDDPSSYSLFAVAPMVFVERDIALGGMPAAIGGAYDFRYETAEVHAAGMSQHGLTAWFKASLDLMTQLTLTGSRKWHDFEVVFPDPLLDSRDGVHDRIAVSLRRELPGAARHVAIGYAWAREDADGYNFDYTGHALSAEFATHVSGPFHVRLRGSVEWRDYNGFFSGFIAPPGRTEMTISELELTGVWEISQDWIADAGVRFIRHDADDPVFSKDRYIVGAGLTRRY